MNANLSNPSMCGDDGLGGWLIADTLNRVVRADSISEVSNPRCAYFTIRAKQIRRLTRATGSATPSSSRTASMTPSQTPTVTFTAARQWIVTLFAGNYSSGFAGDGGA